MVFRWWRIDCWQFHSSQIEAIKIYSSSAPTLALHQTIFLHQTAVLFQFLLETGPQSYDFTLTYSRLILNEMEDWFVNTAGAIDMTIPLERARPLFLRDDYQEFR